MELGSRFQSLARFRIPLAEQWIANPKIADSTRKISRILEPGLSCLCLGKEPGLNSSFVVIEKFFVYFLQLLLDYLLFTLSRP